MYDVELRLNLLVVCKIDGVPNGMEVAQGLEAHGLQGMRNESMISILAPIESQIIRRIPTPFQSFVRYQPH